MYSPCSACTSTESVKSVVLLRLSSEICGDSTTPEFVGFIEVATTMVGGAGIAGAGSFSRVRRQEFCQFTTGCSVID
jgi:hypothetical protein